MEGPEGQIVSKPNDTVMINRSVSRCERTQPRHGTIIIKLTDPARPSLDLSQWVVRGTKDGGRDSVWRWTLSVEDN